MNGSTKIECLSMVPALLANIRLGWKDLPGTNTLAYLSEEWVTQKKIITLRPGANVVKLLHSF
jgi:hypothetical protein